MKVFVDTSALFALVTADDANHRVARETWQVLLDEGATLLTSSYVVVEASGLFQARLGLEAVRALHENLLPVLTTVLVPRETHDLAVRILLAAGRRKLSLVDCTSFELMRREGIDVAFAFDRHFEEQGFRRAPRVPASGVHDRHRSRV